MAMNIHLLNNISITEKFEELAKKTFLDEGFVSSCLADFSRANRTAEIYKDFVSVSTGQHVAAGASVFAMALVSGVVSAVYCINLFFMKIVIINLWRILVWCKPGHGRKGHNSGQSDVWMGGSWFEPPT